MNYPKLKEGDGCCFPERENCNYDEYDIKSRRCVYMKYNNSKPISDPTRWECTYKKETKVKSNQSPLS